jgi:hypothetical protein
VVAVDESGYTSGEIRIDYKILPADYTPASEYVVIYKDDNPIAYISGEAQEGEPARIARGFYFDLEGSYEAQVVLNHGSGAPLEIKSDKIALIPATIYVERHDEEFSDVQLRWNVHYLALRDKTILITAESIEGDASEEINVNCTE